MKNYRVLKAIVFLSLGAFIGLALHVFIDIFFQRHALTAYENYELLLALLCIGISVLLFFSLWRNEHTARELVRVNHFLDSVIENIPHMIFVKSAKDLRFVRFNKAGLDLIGASLSDVIGKNDSDFFPKDQADFFTAKDRHVLDGKRLVDIPCEPFDSNKNKGLRYLHTIKVPILDTSGEPLYLLGISEDITERKKLEADIQSSATSLAKESGNARKFQLAVESSTDAILITDATFKIVYANAAWLTINGYTLEEVLGKTPRILHTSWTDPAITTAMHHALNEHMPFYSDDIINRRKDGKTYNAELSIYPVYADTSSSVLYFVAVLHDITARKRMDIAKSEFVSLASHQLRTPLTAMRLALERLQKMSAITMHDESRSIIHQASEYGQQMAETMHTMLSISRLESGIQSADRSVVRVADLLRAVMHEPHVYIQQKKLLCALNADETLRIDTDATMLREIVANLFGNAMKYSKTGGSITVSAFQRQDNLVITIRDTGIGIPESEKGKIFEKFFRGSNTREHHQSGTGLGLYFVRLAVSFLGGDVSFESTENEGTLFTVVLPPLPHVA
jgi:PAS domain S-box-containing protein